MNGQQLELFNPEEYHDSAFENPMVVKYGKGPEGEKCKNCEHLYFRQYNRRFYKCRLRGDTHGPGTDHQVGHHACSFFKERQVKV